MAEVGQTPSGALALGIARVQRNVLYVVGATLLLGLFLVVAGHARVDIATGSLLLVGLALAGCLRALHRMVGALSRDNLEVVVDTEGEYGGVSERELREERRRVLRAINELRFDHEMGKLSKADYESVRAGFELRAIEVMRALDAGRSLHPALATRLGIVDAPADPRAVTRTDATAEPFVAPLKIEPSAAAMPAEPEADPESVTSRPCLACDRTNDIDARFCKHCGKELVA